MGENGYQMNGPFCVEVTQIEGATGFVPQRTASDFRAQDWIIITEALIEWAWPPTEAS